MLSKQRQEYTRNVDANTLTANRIKAGCIVCKNALETDRDYLHQLVDLDFTQADTFQDSDFTQVFGTDGTVTQDDTGVTVDSSVFTATVPVGNEHVKWLKFYKDVFPVPEDGEILYEARIALQQNIPVTQIPCEYIPRIRNIREDIRLCSGAMNMIDTATWMVFDFLIADDMIYAFYERLPFGKPGFLPGNLDDYAAFSHAVPVHRRASSDPLNDFVDLAIGVRRTSVRYLVNGNEVFRVPRLGLRLNDEYIILDHGGPPQEVEVTSVSAGFGTFSLLDMALPNNYARERVIVDGVDYDCLDVPTQGADTANAMANRNVSHLAQIDLATNYKETYPGFLGRDRDLTDVAGTPATSTFAVSLADIQTADESGDPLTYKLFGQGATLKVQNFKVSARCKLNDADADVRYVPNTLVTIS